MVKNMDISHLKIKDIYSGTLIKVKTTTELYEWIINRHITKSVSLFNTVNGLIKAIENNEDYKWHAAANGFDITEVKKRSRKK